MLACYESVNEMSAFCNISRSIKIPDFSCSVGALRPNQIEKFFLDNLSLWSTFTKPQKNFMCEIWSGATLTYILVIGSLYHSPDHDYDNIGYNIITQHMYTIENRYKDDKRKVVFYVMVILIQNKWTWSNSYGMGY